MRTGFGTDLPHLLLQAADPGTRVSSRGTLELDGHPADAVELVTRAGDRRTLYLDPTTHRLAAADLDDPTAAAGGADAQRVYRDYRPEGGILWPHYEERRLNQRPMMQILVKRVILNSGVDDAVFERPGPELPPPAR